MTVHILKYQHECPNIKTLVEMHSTVESLVKFQTGYFLMPHLIFKVALLPSDKSCYQYQSSHSMLISSLKRFSFAIIIKQASVQQHFLLI